MTPRELLIEMGQNFPEAWRLADEFRADQGKDLPIWDGGVFLPLAGWYAITCHLFGVEKLSIFDGVTLDVLKGLFFAGAWRPGQDIIRFDQDVYESLVQTPFEGKLPADVFWRLPAWAVYIEAPGITTVEQQWDGFMAALEQDMNTGQRELRLLFLREGLPLAQSYMAIIYLGPWDLEEALRRANETVDKNAQGLDLSGLGLRFQIDDGLRQGAILAALRLRLWHGRQRGLFRK